MKIELKKFGTMLISRQAGREALSAFEPILSSLSKDEELLIDFDGVITFSPSWGDEFITPLFRRYDERFKLLKTNNPSVIATMETLKEVHNLEFEFSN
ncbi:MAG: DUF4325 domain-containing protein [Candidatus Pacebacteria bacterium]|nr:DUF4325 domain-containing protein [Candidatus Paceibacterota bacterium]